MVITKYFKRDSQKLILTGEEIYVNPQLSVLSTNGWTEITASDFQSICIAEQQAIQADILQKDTDINDALPSWSEVESIFNNLKADAQAATTLAACKIVLITLITIVKKIARVAYWLAKNSNT